MHPTILAKRKADAVGKLTYAAEALAELMGLDPALIAGLHPVGIHDTLLREMLLLEGAANLIMAVAMQAGAIEHGAPESEAHWVETSEASEPAAEETPEVGPDGLPAPTLEEVLADQPGEEPTAAAPVTMETPAEAEPIEVSESAAKSPAPKKSKSTRKRTKK